MRFLLDSDSLMELEKQQSSLYAKMSKYPASSFVTSVVCAFEFDNGFYGYAGDASPFKVAFKKMKVLPVTQAIALEAARAMATALKTNTIEKSAMQKLKMDALIAATGSHHGLKVITKNTQDFNKLYTNLALNWIAEP